MEDNEDEPEDVRRATPVEEEIRKGGIDEYSGRPTQPLEASRRRHHRCEKDAGRKKLKEKSDGECCHAREVKASRAPKTATVFVYEKKCTLPKIKPIPRHCLTKEEWIDLLATPSRKCPSPCVKKPVTRRIRPVSTRMAELAQPPKQRLLNTLQSRAGTLPTELVDNLIQTLEGETCLTPEQAEKIFREKDIRSRKKCDKRRSKERCASAKEKNLESGGSSNVSTFDKEAVNCQYLMAESFVRSILDWNCPIPREEFKDIAEVILRRLGFILEYSPLNGEDRKSQQMRFLADIIGSWISGVLFEVAEVRKTELEEECERRKRERDEESEEDSDDESEEYLSGKDDNDDDDDDDDDDNDEPDGRKKQDDSRRGGSKDDERKKEDKDDKDDDDEPDERKKKDKDDKDDDDEPDKRKKQDGDRRGGGKDDEKKKEDKDDKDDDDQKRGKERDKDTRESLEKDDVEEDEEFHDARTGTSQEMKEKRSSMTETEVPKETMRDESSDETPEGEQIKEKVATEAEKKRDEEESQGGKEKSETIDAEKREEIEPTEKGSTVAEKLPVSLNENITERKDDEISRKIDVERIAKERIDDQQVQGEIDHSKSPEASRKDVEKEPMEIGEDATPIKIASSPEESGATERTKISEEETSAARKTTIGEEEMTRINGEAEKLDEPGLKPARTSEIPQGKPDVTLDSGPDSEGEKKIVQDLKTASPRDSAISFSIGESRESEKLTERDEELARIIETSEKLTERDEELARIVETSEKSWTPVDKLKKKIVDGEIKRISKKCSNELMVANKYRTDTPFVTFDKIFNTIYNAIEASDENKGTDVIANRLHRAVYEKFASVVQEEKPGPLSELTKDVLEVMSGKIAIWLRNVLTESQLNFVNKFPATVESTEIREWTRWISSITDTADDWSKWIQNTIRQAEGMSSGKVTRGDWANWTENVDIDALRWRKFYLESLHKGHQNITMIRDRRVVKTGTKEFHEYNENTNETEREVKITDLEVEGPSTD